MIRFYTDGLVVIMSDSRGLVGSSREGVFVAVCSNEQNFDRGVASASSKESSKKQRLKKWLNYSLIYTYIYKYICLLEIRGYFPPSFKNCAIAHLCKLLVILENKRGTTPDSNPLTSIENLQVVASDYR